MREMEPEDAGGDLRPTAGGVEITRRRTETPYEGAISEAYVEALDFTARMPVFLELRISRALYAMGHGHRRSATVHHGGRVAAPCGSRRSTSVAAPSLPPVLAAVEALSDVTVEQAEARLIALRVHEPLHVVAEEERFAARPRCSACLGSSLASFVPMRTAISACTARSATIWRSSSIRSI